MRFLWYRAAALGVAASLLLAACGGGTPATPVVPTPTQYVAPVSTTVPVVTPTATPDPNIPLKSKDPTSFFVVQGNEPDTLDPAVTMDRASFEILQNVYDTLVFFKRDSVTEFIPQLAEEVPSIQNGGISPDGRTYTFKIRQGVMFHNGDELKASDVAFTFQRGLLGGGSNSPQSLLFEPLLGTTPNNDITDLIDISGSLLDKPDRVAAIQTAGMQALCRRVQGVVTADDAKGTVSFHLAQPWGPFLMILAGPYASIQDQKWVAANGGWNGDCATWQNFYDRTVDQQNQAAIGRSANGTGPFRLDHWTPGQEIVLKANPGYWRKEPAWDGGPSGTPTLQTVTIQITKGGNSRVNTFKSGSADTIGFYSSSKATALDELSGELCNITGQCTPTQVPDSSIRTYMGLPASAQMDIVFNFSITAFGGNPSIGSGKLDGAGIPPNFFADVHVRQAFSYCFDAETFINKALGGQGVPVHQIMLPGQIGADPNNPHYGYDPQACADAFKASIWKSVDGKSLWDTGFQVSLPFNPKDTDGQAAWEILSNGISAVNDKFVIRVTNVQWESYQDDYRNKRLPLYFVTARGSLPDPHFWSSTLATGALGAGLAQMPKGMRYQFDTLVGQGVQATDPAARGKVYQHMNQAYFDAAPAILVAQELTRRYEQRWVKGYYFNPMIADLYFYALSKE